MNFFLDAFIWLTDPHQWSSASQGIPIRLFEHLAITAFVIAITAVIIIPTGVIIGHYRIGSGFIGAVTGAARALPTLGVLTLFALLLGIGVQAPIVALIILAIPSVLAAAYSGVANISPIITFSAHAQGMSTSQVMTRVEVPLALPVLVGGIRAATLQVVATATLAAYTSDFGLGRYIFIGLKTRNYEQMIGGAILIILLALCLEVLLAILQRFVSKRYYTSEDSR